MAVYGVIYTVIPQNDRIKSDKSAQHKTGSFKTSKLPSISILDHRALI